MKKVKIKVISKKEAMELGLTNNNQMFILQAIGSSKSNKAHTIKIQDIETGQERFILKDGKKQKFKEFDKK